MLVPALAKSDSSQKSRPLRWASKKMGMPKLDLEDKETLWLSLDPEQVERDAGVSLIDTRDRGFRRFDGITVRGPST